MVTTKHQKSVIPRRLEAPLQDHTSFKNIPQIKNANNVKLPDTSDGRKYGYVAQNSPRKTLGHRSCGFASAPPYSGLQGCCESRDTFTASYYATTHAMVAPMQNVTGIKAKTWAMFVWSVTSPSILFITPTFPLSTPAVHRLESHH